MVKTAKPYAFRIYYSSTAPHEYKRWKAPSKTVCITEKHIAQIAKRK